MSKLQKSLREWREHQLINEEQYQKIIEYESQKPESSWILTSILILGAAIIGVGVISVIAANWDLIPASIKLLNNFLLLGLTSYVLFQSWKAQKYIRYEALLFFYVILCLASIGLISQVFHTGGKLYQALLLWSVLTFAAIATAKHFFVPFLWSGAFLASIAYMAADSDFFELLFAKHFQAIMAAATLLSAVLTVVFKTLSDDEAPLTRAFRYWIVVSGLFAILWVEFDSGYRSFEVVFRPYVPAYLFAAVTFVSLMLRADYRKIQKVVLSCCLLLFLSLMHMRMLDKAVVFDSLVYSLLIAGLTVGILSLMAVYLVSIKSEKLFQIFLFFIGIRFLVLYFQALGGLAYTGIGLIISGLIVVASATLWNKYRKKITHWVEGWVR